MSEKDADPDVRKTNPPLWGPLPASGIVRTDSSSPVPPVCDLYGLVFGIVLGLSIVKFGNPVILDRVIAAPADLREAWLYAWPVRWSFSFLLVLVVAGAALILTCRLRWRGTRWLWMLPSAWLAWQFVSATQTVDGRLTVWVLGQFGGCLACYFAGALLLRNKRALDWVMIGLIAASAFCLVRAANQRLFEFPQERQLLLEGERTGWTNIAPHFLARLKSEQVVVTTNGIDVANPVIMAKYAKGRVHGTLMYPNALAGLLLLLWPVALAIAVCRTRHFRSFTRLLVIVLTFMLGGMGFYWTGSKLGWLISLALLCFCLLQLKWPREWKVALLALVMIAGVGVFVIRFHDYFAGGARSAGARFDYWNAAVQVIQQRPWMGSGPGTFQRPYAQLKRPDAEMARLTHNDYLEQFSDSGIPGGMIYCAWIMVALIVGWRRVGRSHDIIGRAVFVGVLGWYLQGVGEFSLYIPGLAWPAFTLLGWCVAQPFPPASFGVGPVASLGTRDKKVP